MREILLLLDVKNNIEFTEVDLIRFDFTRIGCLGKICEWFVWLRAVTNDGDERVPRVYIQPQLALPGRRPSPVGDWFTAGPMGLRHR